MRTGYQFKVKGEGTPYAIRAMPSFVTVSLIYLRPALPFPDRRPIFDSVDGGKDSRTVQRLFLSRDACRDVGTRISRRALALGGFTTAAPRRAR